MTKQDKIPDPLAGIAPLDIAAAFDAAPPPIDIVLPGMIAGTVGSLVAQGGAGKSWLALEIAVGVAGGPDLAEIGIPAHGRVVYLPAEDPRSALAHRFHALAGHLAPDARRTVSNNLTVLPLMGHQVNIGEAAWADALERVCDSARLAIVDTLRRFHIEDENASGPMAQLLGVMEGICERTGASILFLHHTAKGAALNGAGGEQQAARGSSVLVDNIRGGQWNLLGMTETEAERHKVDDRKRFVRLVQAKANFGPPIPDKWLERGAGGVLKPALTLENADGIRKNITAKVVPHPSSPDWRGTDR
ncbi:helicase RepA family protein [Paracoccus shanxieyensis]|uniref:AAA family ATPase n=1 Tax=Paracoccus shanxieyensis TaxID=2675752 RepID=A0A6L6J443_9RHOB|nr:helicase RepA family protein [Paracoccus shanxieyensis]MTH66172.1 AAA family ATPase [Paracoccus shanxieyensis]MTH89435.1 AAA family ATPase [Paracoccus shanxieyensis]